MENKAFNSVCRSIDSASDEILRFFLRKRALFPLAQSEVGHLGVGDMQYFVTKGGTRTS